MLEEHVDRVRDKLIEPCLRLAGRREPPDMSSRRDVNVAGVTVEARHLPELITRLRTAGYPFVAEKVERALSLRTVHVGFDAAEREAIVRAVADKPPAFAELYRVLRAEIQRRRRDPLS